MNARLWVVMFFLLPCHSIWGQDLEPRRWTHLPINMNVAGAGVVATDGVIHFDPVQRIENAKFELYSIAESYVRSFEWLGKTSRIEFRVPYSMGRWEGLVNGEYVSTRRHGFADPRVRLAVNLIGAPPLEGAEFMQYRASHTTSTIVGAALSVTLPLGEYNSARLINLGGNRFVYRPQIGVLHQRGPWQFEVTSTVSFYENNDDFYGGSVVEQDHMWFFEGHVVRTLAGGKWLGLSGGYSYDGNTQVNGVVQHNDDHTRYWAFNFGMPLSKTQSVKLTYLNAETNVLVGNDFESLILSWSINWFSN